jgi:hypothetical protein
MTRPMTILCVLAGVAGLPRPGAAKAVHAIAEHVTSDRVVVPGDSGVFELPVHPSVLTMMYFPDSITRYLRSDEKNFIVGATGSSLAVRPLPDAATGTIASVNIVTQTMRISVRLRVVEVPEDAHMQVSFVPYVVDVSPPVPLKDRLSLHVLAALGRAWIGENTAGAEPAYLGTVAALLMVRGSRFHAYETGIMVGQTTSTRFGALPFEPDMGEQTTGDLQHASLLTRLSIGASARLGTRLTPVLRVHVGVQGRTIFGSRHQISGSVFASDNRTRVDLTGSAGLGLMYQINQTWILGFGASVTRAMPLYGDSTYDSLEGVFHVGWF